MEGFLFIRTTLVKSWMCKFNARTKCQQVVSMFP